MSEVSLIPTGNNGGWGGEAVAAGFGGFIGSLFGNGWGGGWGNRGNWGAPCSGAVASGFAENAVLNSLNDINTGVTNLGMNLIQGQGRNDLTACQGFSGINTAILTSSANQTNWTNQGFAGLNTAIVQNGYDTRQEIANNRFAQQECCCALQKQMADGFGSIREKMDQQTITTLQTQLCDAKSKISALESQAFITQSNLAQSANIIGHVRAMIPTTTTTTGTTA